MTKKDSIIEMENEINKLESVVRGLKENLGKLKLKDNSLENVDIGKEINKLKKNITHNEELIKEKHKSIIDKFGVFINEQLRNSKIENYEKKLILSYIKYYFNKINTFFKKYNDKSDSLKDYKKKL